MLIAEKCKFLSGIRLLPQEVRIAHHGLPETRRFSSKFKPNRAFPNNPGLPASLLETRPAANIKPPFQRASCCLPRSAAMELRSGRRPASPPAPRGGVRPARPKRSHADGKDRISDLPKELCLEVLLRLGCAREAARTSVLSRPWRGLWTELRDLNFDDVGDPDSLGAALATVRPDLDRLRISDNRCAYAPSRGSPRCYARLTGLLLLLQRPFEPRSLGSPLPTPAQARHGDVLPP
jgi:hypothetical protein